MTEFPKMHEDAGDGVCANCPWCDANLDYAEDARGTCAWCGHTDAGRILAALDAVWDLVIRHFDQGDLFRKRVARIIEPVTERR